ncbi:MULTISPECIES: glutaredoxin family protein [Pseudoalteromonas]|uniref:Glutaredoxin n=1 Tax=Pseudoalteromonas obscura TaxID=3048491 RepID=A0ABT7EJB7_9GAMM|nr:glutaredoxin [Pseudoalteromonas sp. P94(2023)]MBQ4836684.1 glutaredoxin [Pseudoalteromonas luteoviolacea]MDK2595112.1 glutaredoxin [Pseudoalteromonas sp. P94(2023)]
MNIATKVSKTRSTGFNQTHQKLSLYYRPSCPYCHYVLGALKAHNINIELRNITDSAEYETELIKHGGKRQVPCLLVRGEGADNWMYESQDIIDYLLLTNDSDAADSECSGE